ncbi:hypothetical protein B0T22DRAFT_293575 [Podospora appendiculata]|uniref:Uncharacterized protein n=1 Tax=Podospora appendiculata TaxID=314037 RepID=A0AAE1C8F4_9PEZI|nr:hypothetical protein B0T22DRAFT_293575 [Podospora appendiculata]
MDLLLLSTGTGTGTHASASALQGEVRSAKCVGTQQPVLTKEPYRAHGLGVNAGEADAVAEHPATSNQPRRVMRLGGQGRSYWHWPVISRLDREAVHEFCLDSQFLSLGGRMLLGHAIHYMNHTTTPFLEFNLVFLLLQLYEAFPSRPGPVMFLFRHEQTHLLLVSQARDLDWGSCFRWTMPFLSLDNSCEFLRRDRLCLGKPELMAVYLPQCVDVSTSVGYISRVPYKEHVPPSTGSGAVFVNSLREELSKQDVDVVETGYSLT